MSVSISSVLINMNGCSALSRCVTFMNQNTSFAAKIVRKSEINRITDGYFIKRCSR